MLGAGENFEIRNAQDYFGEPVLTGVYDGASVTLPMTNLRVASPIGISTPPASGPEFNLFVVRTTKPSAPANTAPTLSSIPDQRISAGSTTAPLPFTVSDAEISADKLAVLASSSNPTLVPASNISLSGSGPTRYVTVTPASSLTGTANITLAVTDGSLVTSRSFTLTVVAPSSPTTDLVNDYPTMTPIPDQNATVGVRVGPSPFTIGDIDSPFESLRLAARSSNPTIVPSERLVLGGSGANRTITITPAPNQFGTPKIYLNLNDGSKTVEKSFYFTSAP